MSGYDESEANGRTIERCIQLTDADHDKGVPPHKLIDSDAIFSLRRSHTMQNINLPDAKAMKASERNWRVTGAAADKRCMEAHLLIQDNAEEPDPLSRVKMAWCSNLIAGFMHIYLDTTAQTYWMSLGCHRKAALLLGPLQTTVVHCRDGQLLTFICFKKPRDIATRWKILYDCFDPARGAACAPDDFTVFHSGQDILK